MAGNGRFAGHPSSRGWGCGALRRPRGETARALWGTAALAACFLAAVSATTTAGAASDRDGDDSLLAFARERAALCAGAPCAGAVIVGFANMGYSKFALNWVLSMRHVGIENYVLVALDARAHAYFVRLGVPCLLWPVLSAPPAESQHHQSAGFRDMMHIRLRAVLALLRGGLDVWLTDVDAVFNNDPFPFVSAEVLGSHAAALAYDTPFLPKGRNSPLMVMAGFFFLRRCALPPDGPANSAAGRGVGAGAAAGAGAGRELVFAENCDLLSDTLLHAEAHPDKHDQFSFNAALAEREKRGYEYTLLDPLLFCNGALYFAERAPQMLGLRAVVVQNNHITGAQSKQHRFREHLLWYLDPPAYYANASARYLIYDNVQAAATGVLDERTALYNALMLAEVLGRTLILPLFCLYHPAPGLYAGSSDWCTAEEFFDLDVKRLGVKEHSFLLNPQTPASLKAAAEAAPVRMLSVGRESLTEGAVVKMLAGERESAVLKVGGLHDVRLQRAEADARASFEARVVSAMVPREETLRHVNTTVRDLGPRFVCVLVWGDTQTVPLSKTRMGELLEALALMVDPAEGVYLAVDGIEAAHLDAFRILFPAATAFEVYPWLVQGLRRYQLATIIHQGVCAHAHTVIADLSLAAPRALCALWRELGGPDCVSLSPAARGKHAQRPAAHLEL